MTGIICALPGIIRPAVTGRTAKTVTASGNAQVDTAQSKFGGASALFDGTGDRLDITSASDLALGSGDFTIEYWVRYSSVSGNQVIIDFRDTAANGAYILLGNNGGAAYLYVNGDYRIGNSGTQFAIDTWYHVALSRSGTSTKLFINGTQTGSTYSDSNSYLGTAPDIGELNSSFGLTGFGTIGWIDEFRISNTARYTSNFTAPTAAFVNDENTLLLLHMDGTDASTVFTDDNGVRLQKGIVAQGDAQVDTAQSKFGGASALFDGTGDNLIINSISDFGVGTGDFTYECWFRTTTASTAQCIFDMRPVSTNGLYPAIFINNSKLGYYFNSSYRISDGSTLSDNTWYHFALTRESGETKIWLNGTQDGSSYTDTSSHPGHPTGWFGRSQSSGGFPFNGHMDEIRVSDIARYSASFTPSTTPFQNDSNTLLLIHCDGTDASTTFTDDNS